MGLGGGILGAVIGGLCGGPLGAMIGAGLGLYLTRDRSEEVSSSGMESGGNAFPGISFFMCLGKMAKSDGRVTQDEASFISALLKELNFSREERDLLREAFRAGRDSELTFLDLAAKFSVELEMFNNSRAFREGIMSIFCSLAAVDHTISPEERENLLIMESELHLTGYVNQFFASNESSSAYQSNTHSSSLTECYSLLGITPSATDAEVKRAWHKKALEFHPDHVQGAGMSQAVIDQAKRKMQEINDAYERIRKARGF